MGFIIENHEEKEANVSVQGTFTLPPGQQYAVICQGDDDDWSWLRGAKPLISLIMWLVY